MDLEDPANEPQLDSLLKLGVSPEKAPNEPKYITIGFERVNLFHLTARS